MNLSPEKLATDLADEQFILKENGRLNEQTYDNDAATFVADTEAAQRESMEAFKKEEKEEREEKDKEDHKADPSHEAGPEVPI